MGRASRKSNSRRNSRDSHGTPPQLPAGDALRPHTPKELDGAQAEERAEPKKTPYSELTASSNSTPPYFSPAALVSRPPALGTPPTKDESGAGGLSLPIEGGERRDRRRRSSEPLLQTTGSTVKGGHEEEKALSRLIFVHEVLWPACGCSPTGSSRACFLWQLFFMGIIFCGNLCDLWQLF